MAGVVHHVQNATFDGFVIRIVKDDVRALATQFKMDLFQRIGCRFRNQRARAGGAGEADHVDVFMRRHLAANADAVTVHKVEHTFGEACLVHQFGKDHRVQRAFLGGFQHHCAAGYDRSPDLERDLVHRPVPWRDQARDANRLADDPVVGCVVAKRLFEFELFRGFDEVAQMVCAGPDLRGAGQIHRRTHGGAHRLGQIFGAGLIDLEELFQKRDAVSRRGRHPAGQGRFGGGNCSVGICLIPKRDDRAGLLCGGVDHVIVIRLGGGYPFTVDVKLALLQHGKTPFVMRCRGHFPDLLRVPCHHICRPASEGVKPAAQRLI